MTDAAVSDEDFEDIRAATRHFVRSVVMPREMEIMAQDRVPDDIRDEARVPALLTSGAVTCSDGFGFRAFRCWQARACRGR